MRRRVVDERKVEQGMGSRRSEQKWRREVLQGWGSQGGSWMRDSKRKEEKYNEKRREEKEK